MSQLGNLPPSRDDHLKKKWSHNLVGDWNFNPNYRILWDTTNLCSQTNVYMTSSEWSKISLVAGPSRLQTWKQNKLRPNIEMWARGCLTWGYYAFWEVTVKKTFNVTLKSEIKFQNTQTDIETRIGHNILHEWLVTGPPKKGELDLHQAWTKGSKLVPPQCHVSPGNQVLLRDKHGSEPSKQGLILAGVSFGGVGAP